MAFQQTFYFYNGPKDAASFPVFFLYSKLYSCGWNCASWSELCLLYSRWIELFKLDPRLILKFNFDRSSLLNVELQTISQHVCIMSFQRQDMAPSFSHGAAGELFREKVWRGGLERKFWEEVLWEGFQRRFLGRVFREDLRESFKRRF